MKSLRNVSFYAGIITVGQMTVEPTVIHAVFAALFFAVALALEFWIDGREVA